jgi:hypothetical protein
MTLWVIDFGLRFLNSKNQIISKAVISEVILDHDLVKVHRIYPTQWASNVAHRGNNRKMHQIKFSTNSAIVCYNCRRFNVLGQTNTAQEGDVMQIFFVSCPVCLNLLSVHNPITATFPRYLDPRGYADIVDFLRSYYSCAPKVPQQRKFSVTALRIKSLSRIRDVSEFTKIEAVQASCATIWKRGRSAPVDSWLFKRDLPLIAREPFNYPQITEFQERGFSSCVSVLNRLHTPVSSRDVNVPLCPTCFSDLSEAPPAYMEATSEKNPPKVLGMYLHIFYDKSWLDLV